MDEEMREEGRKQERREVGICVKERNKIKSKTN